MVSTMPDSLTTHIEVMAMRGRKRCMWRGLSMGIVVCLCVMGHLFFFSDLDFTAGNPTHSNPDVVIVEEHHEVLHYWFEAANNGLTSKSGLTLVHIDGHGDNAPPDPYPGFPLFRLPGSWEEVNMMMQSNDAFILGAVTTGLIHRFIWIWPSWDRPNHKSEYSSGNTDIGVIQLPDTSVRQETFCVCNDKSGQWLCMYANKSAIDNEGIQEIPVSQCKIRVSFLWEEISEDLALQKLKSGRWFQKEEEILLDIDEDYFGCESALQPLTDVGLAWTAVDTLNYRVGLLLCPQTTSQEKQADLFLVQMLKIIIQNCEDRIPCLRHYLKNDLERFTEPLIRSKHSFLCPGALRVKRKRLDMLLRELIILTELQLQTLTEVGFCLQTTPKSYFFPQIEYDRFRVCHGVNIPNQTVVMFHTPTEAEFIFRMNLLGKILTSQGMPKPRMVTVCRSMRDAYTPRKYFRRIETGILNSFKNNAKVYDADLLGGPYGWPGRHEARTNHKRKQHK